MLFFNIIEDLLKKDVSCFYLYKLIQFFVIRCIFTLCILTKLYLQIRCMFFITNKQMPVSFDTLNKLHLFAALAHSTQSIYTFVLANGKYKDQGKFTVTNQVVRPTKDGVTNETYKVGTFRLANLIGIFPALSTMNHLWAYFDRTRYEQYVNEGFNPIRWLEYSISAGVPMVGTISLLSAQSDIKALISQGVGNVALQYIGYMIEKQVATSRKISSPRYYETGFALELVGGGIFASYWIPIMVSFFTSVSTETRKDSNEIESNQMDGKPDAVIWSIIFVMTILMLSFAVLSVLYLRSAGVNKRWMIQDFKSVEVGYIILSLAAKTFLTNMALFGALFSTQEDQIE
jgi:hypothetical protein